ncbi:MAG: hypothetical protein R3A10_04310 [Caldilineaceae bacterium]
MSTGASLERVRLEPATWQTAATSWPGSAGDLETAGRRVRSRRWRRASAVDPPSPGATPTPDGELPANDGPRTLMLSEFLANPGAVGDGEGEWIELFNWGDAGQPARLDPRRPGHGPLHRSDRPDHSRPARTSSWRAMGMPRPTAAWTRR